MSQVGVKCLSTRSTEEHGTQNQEPLWRLRQQNNSVIGIDGLQYHGVRSDLTDVCLPPCRGNLVMAGAVVSLDFAWSFAGFIIYIFLLTHNNIKHHHQHETYGEADGAEIAVLAA